MREVLELLDFFVRETDSFRPAMREDGELLHAVFLIFWKGGGEFSPLFSIVEFTIMNIFRFLYFP